MRFSRDAALVVGGCFALGGFEFLGAHSPSKLIAIIAVVAIGASMVSRSLLRGATIAYIFVLASAPFASITLRGLNVPLIALLGGLCITANLFQATGEVRRPQGRGLLGVGIWLCAVLGSLSFAATVGRFGQADTTEYLKWAVALASFWFLARSAVDMNTLARVFVTGAVAGAAFALWATYAPGGTALMESLSALGYVRSGADARYFIQDGVLVSARVSGTYTDPNIAAIFFLVAIALSIVIRPRRWRLLGRVVLGIAFVLCLSRGAFGGAAIMVLCLAVVSRLSITRRIALVTSTSVLAIFLLLIPTVSQRILTTFSSADTGSSARARAFHDFSSVMAGNWGAGLGWGRPEFRDSAAAFRVVVVANAPLASVYRGGLVAGAGFVILCLLAALRGLRDLRSRVTAESVCGALALGLLAISQTGYSLALISQVTAVFSFVLAVLASGDRLGRLEAAGGSPSTCAKNSVSGKTQSIQSDARSARAALRGAVHSRAQA